MINPTVLVIDDEPDIRELFSMTLKRMDLVCDVAASVAEGKKLLRERVYALVLTDMRMDDGDGFDIINFVQKNNPEIPVAVITAYGNIEAAVSALKAGAFDYVSKPVDVLMLKNLVQAALRIQKTKRQATDLLVGDSPVIKKLQLNIEKLSRNQAPVFIFGESGVGKELAARLIHRYGPRSEKPFVAVNCGAIPSELMEAEFFGYKKGSFTSAYSDKQGLFEAAEGGTLFLDEIADLPASMQVKLLRAIQEKAVKPIGSSIEVPFDVRILSASNKNLQTEVSEGRFRRELFYRVNVIELYVPTLAERISDIPLLTEAILTKIAEKQQGPKLRISKDCIQRLKKYSFPGNVRELENILERAVAMATSDCIELDDLQLPAEEIKNKDLRVSSQQNLENSLEEHEKEMILQALQETKWNRTAAARILGLSFRALRYRLKKLGLD